MDDQNKAVHVVIPSRPAANSRWSRDDRDVVLRELHGGGGGYGPHKEKRISVVGATPRTERPAGQYARTGKKHVITPYCDQEVSELRWPSG